VELDVLTAASCYRAIERAVERFGRLDILVNNAGTSIRKAPEDLTAQDWDLVLNTNLTSAFLCSQAAYPHMLRAGGGKIINIGSMMSIFGMPFATAYAASKGGIVQMTRAMATAWATDNIQVNTILPGWIDTDLTRSARQEIPGLHEKVLARTPAQRWGTPDDFAGIAIFLGSPASNFITGAAIPVGGGYSKQG
jgi:2-dehydro-3-deoxy-D-gluconate 5-dehydrogenase